MSTASSFELEMLALINEERTSRGLQPLQLETRLNESSEDHSAWMLNTDTFSHTGAGGSSATQRMRDAGFDFSGSWRSGENIAWQSERGAPGISDDVAQLHQSLMDSPGHRANILNPDFKYIGIGIERGDMQGYDAVVVTQNFATTDADVVLDTGNAPAAPAPTPPVVVVDDPADVEVPVVEEQPAEPEAEAPVTPPQTPEPTPVADEPTPSEPEAPETVVADSEPEVVVPEAPVAEAPEPEVVETETPEPPMPAPEPVDMGEDDFDSAALLAQLEMIFDSLQAQFDDFYWAPSGGTAPASNSDTVDFVSVRTPDADVETTEPSADTNTFWDYDWFSEFDVNCSFEIA